MPLWLALAACSSTPEVPLRNDPARVFDFDGDGFADVALSHSAEAVGDPSPIYVLRGGPDGLDAVAPTRLEYPYQVLPATLSYLGDLDGDGRSDLAASNPMLLGGTRDVHVYFGADGTVEPLVLPDPAPPSSPDEVVGAWAGPAGDVNGDGWEDLLIVRPHDLLAVHYGGPEGLATEPDATLRASDLPSPWADDPNFVGFSASSTPIGDTNADGYGDVVLGLHFLSAPSGGGEEYVLARGGPEGLQTFVPIGDVFTLHDQQIDILGLVDVDADGRTDLLRGLTTNEGPGYFAIHRRLPSGEFPLAAELQPEPDPSGALTMRPVPDLDGDGVDDFAVGGEYVYEEEVGENGWSPMRTGGAVHLGTGDGFEIQPSFRLAPRPGHTSEDVDRNDGIDPIGFGSRVRGVGDVNGDGFGDLVVLEEINQTLPLSNGEYLLYLGRAKGRTWEPAQHFFLTGQYDLAP